LRKAPREKGDADLQAIIQAGKNHIRRHIIVGLRLYKNYQSKYRSYGREHPKSKQ
jgi:hypothetical protein